MVQPSAPDTEKVALEKLKLKLEIQNLQDNGLSNFEKLVKRRIVPIFLPFLTLLATCLFFCLTWKAGEKSKAIDRYKSEVDMIDMVWGDMKSGDTASAAFKTSKDFLIGVFNANATYYVKDNDYLGIKMDQRPIKIITNMNRGMRKEALKLEANAKFANAVDELPNSKKADIKIPDTVSGTQSVLAFKPKEVVAAANDLASSQMKVYIQYRNKPFEEMANHLSTELKPFYIVPPIDYVGNLKYGNQIRYYTNADLVKAQQLAAKIKEITGQHFVLKNINNTAITNVMEIWYNNLPIAKTVPPLVDAEYYTAPGYETKITDSITVQADAFNAATGQATFRINRGTPMVFKKGIAQTVTVGENNITITVSEYKLVRLKRAVYYHLLLRKKA